MVRDIIILIAVFMIIPVNGSSDYISDYRNKCNELIMAGQSIEEDQRLWQLFDANWKYQMEASPESATWRGYPGQNHRWSDLSLQALNDGKEIDRLTLKTILSVVLNSPKRISLIMIYFVVMLRWQLKSSSSQVIT